MLSDTSERGTQLNVEMLTFNSAFLLTILHHPVLCLWSVVTGTDTKALKIIQQGHGAPRSHLMAASSSRGAQLTWIEISAQAPIVEAIHL